MLQAININEQNLVDKNFFNGSDTHFIENAREVQHTLDVLKEYDSSR